MSTVTLAEAKTHLNLGAATTHAAEVQSFIDRAEGAVERRCGPLVAVATTERVRGARRALSVENTPILTLTSVTPVNGTALDLASFVVHKRAGVIEYESAATFASRWYDVVYQCGHGATAATVPANLKLGVLELIRHLWLTQRGGTARPGSTPSDTMANTVPGSAYIFPYRVEQLIVPYEKVAV